MPDWNAPHNGHAERAQDAPANVGDAPAPCDGRIRLRKIAENKSANAVELPCLPKMHQHAIHLIGLHRAILQNKDGILRLQLPRRSDRCFEKCEASTEHTAFGFACDHRLALQVERPAAPRFAHCAAKGGFIVPARNSGTGVKARRNHWPVKGYPAAALPQKNLQRRDVAEAKNTFRRTKSLRHKAIEQTVRTVSAPQGDEALHVCVGQPGEEFGAAFSGRCREVSVRRACAAIVDPKAEPAEFLKSRRRSAIVGGRCGSENTESGARLQRAGLASLEHRTGR